MNTKVEKLEERVERICGVGNAWIPSWLRTVGSREEIAEWRAIRQARRGRDCHERMLEFIRGMRKKNPDMPLSFEEELEARVKELKNNPALAKAEGIEWVLQRQRLEELRNIDRVLTGAENDELQALNASLDKFQRERE